MPAFAKGVGRAVEEFCREQLSNVTADITKLLAAGKTTEAATIAAQVEPYQKVLQVVIDYRNKNKEDEDSEGSEEAAGEDGGSRKRARKQNVS